MAFRLKSAVPQVYKSVACKLITRNSIIPIYRAFGFLANGKKEENTKINLAKSQIVSDLHAKLYLIPN